MIVKRSARVQAPAERVYSLIADYRNGHPRIVPPAFHSIEVIEGGYGEGTVIHFQAKVMGVNKKMRSRISEPEPGRVLVEKDLDSPTVTRFIVIPAGADQCDVTIETEIQTRSGIGGSVEGFLIPRLLQKIYKEELELLAEVAGGNH